ncbi:MAG: hypothetical protein Q9219_004303 [cf. Caloplaca sp. 3 TL-2023]
MTTLTTSQHDQMNSFAFQQTTAVPSFPFARQHRFEPPSENAELRQKEPVSKVKLFDGTEAWVVAKHADIRAALESDKLSADRRTPGFPEIHQGGKKALEKRPTFVNVDEPEHRRQRNMFESFFTPKAVQQLQPTMQETVDTILDKMVQDGCQEPVDFIHKFAEPIPIQIIYRMLGIPEEDIESLSRHSEVRMNTSGNAAESSENDLAQYMSQLVDKRIANPGDDLISRLVVEQYMTGNLEKEDVNNLIFLLLVAGNAAVTNSISTSVVTLFQHPAQLEEFKQKPTLAKDVVNECLRYNTASALNSRRAAKEDITIGGKHIKKGEGVICLVQSADRDESFFKGGPQFDIHHEYDPQDTLGFGHGPHRCIAEWLSRAELEVALTTLFKRLPNLKLAVPVEELKFTPPAQNIGITEMPVVW